uniref:Phospholipid:diacylglycerol acyltransferase n=1 Tax=Fagus sylvatica TaxID=28930 RepID=A0A2N9IXW9_FAGSY
MPLIRRKKPAETEKNSEPESESESNIQNEESKEENVKTTKKKKNGKAKLKKNKWSCVDSCCWFIGYVCTVWWVILLLYNAMPASLPQFVTEKITGPMPDPPGVKLKKEGLKAKHPVVFVPGIVTGGLELWEGHQCADGLFRKRLWGGTFGEVYKRPLCWVEHMSLDNETGLDPPGIRVRDQTLSRIKSSVELMVATSGEKAVIIPHSMGVLYFLHFMKWVEEPAPMGGGGGSDWCSKHIKAVMNIGGPFLGVPKAVSGLFSAEAKDIAVARAIAPGFLDNDLFRFQTLQHVMKMSRTWDSTMSMIPKGGDTIWGDLDWSPEEGFVPNKRRQKENDTQSARQSATGNLDSQNGKVDAIKGYNFANSTCRDAWTEYHDMGIEGIRAVAEHKVYTTGSILDLLEFVAPKMMARGSTHFSYGIADNLDDPKYKHYKHWSNPLETRLPNAPDMEIFSMYGVGIPTERAYVYKLSPLAECYIPFQIDTSAISEDEDSCLKDGVYTVDGDETVPVLSAGFMCAKGWRGKTRFNPSGIRTYNREYDHSPPSNLLEGRGTQSGAHVDIMGNFALIEDVVRVAAGATGEDLGGDRVYSDIFEWSEKINLQL